METIFKRGLIFFLILFVFTISGNIIFRSIRFGEEGISAALDIFSVSVIFFMVAAFTLIAHRSLKLFSQIAPFRRFIWLFSLVSASLFLAAVGFNVFVWKGSQSAEVFFWSIGAANALILVFSVIFLFMKKSGSGGEDLKPE